MNGQRPSVQAWLSTHIIPPPDLEHHFQPSLCPNHLPIVMTQRISQGLTLAVELHGGQSRKGTCIPYLTHLMAVAAMVGEHGGSEDEVIGALLHDAAEDCGGRPILARIEYQFGAEVASIVEGCSDDLSGGEKSPWLTRKAAYLCHLAKAPLPALRVSCADKLHNVRTINADLKHEGESVFDRFQGGKTGTLWYYQSLSEIFGAILEDEGDEGFERLALDLGHSVGEMELWANRPIRKSKDWTPASNRARTQKLLRILRKPYPES